MRDLTFLQDFFYVCPSHLKEKAFCSPIIDEAAVAAKKKKQMEEEVEKVKKEFEEKKKKKEEKEKEKSKDKDKDKDDEKKDEKKDDEKVFDQLTCDRYLPLITLKKPLDTTSATSEEEPRVFALQKNFYQQRIDKKRNAEIARRNRERLQNPNLFPQVPKDLP